MKKILTILASLLACATLFSAVGCDNGAGSGEKDGSEPVVGIKMTEINEKGELVIIYTDGREENLGVVVGKDGEDGKDGANGADGKNGEDGKDGLDGKDGVDGKDGKDGEDGKNGRVEIVGSDLSAAVSRGLMSSVSIYCHDSAGKVVNAGSGVIFKLDKERGEAYILTNYHVVYHSGGKNSVGEKIYVYLYGSDDDESKIAAEYVGSYPDRDIAVLHISDSELIKSSDAMAAELDTDKIAGAGNVAIAIGNAKRMGISATVGCVNVDSEYVNMKIADGSKSVSMRVMRIDCAINRGNSGGGVFDGEGKLIGIVNAKLSESDVDGIGYAIPISVAAGIADLIIDSCNGTDSMIPTMPSLGFSVNGQGAVAEYDTASGALTLREDTVVSSVDAEGIGAKSGVIAGDVVKSIAVNGETDVLDRHFQLNDIILTLRKGDKVNLTLDREGETVSVEMEIE